MRVQKTVNLTVGPCFQVFSTIQGKTRAKQAKHFLSLLLRGSHSYIHAHAPRPAQCWAWALEMLNAWLKFGISNGLKKNWNSAHWHLCCDFGGYDTFTTRWSGGRVQVRVQVWAPACHMAISLKAVPEDNRRFRGQNQLPSSWGRAPAWLAQVGRASTNTGRFRVSGSRCGPRQARLRKTCYHSCDTDSVQESTRF